MGGSKKHVFYNKQSKKNKKNNDGRAERKTRKADPVCFLKRTIGKAMWQAEENRVSGKDTNLKVIPSASATDALIRQKGNIFSVIPPLV